MVNGRDHWPDTPEDAERRRVAFRRYMTLIAVLLLLLVGAVIWTWAIHRPSN